MRFQYQGSAEPVLVPSAPSVPDNSWEPLLFDNVKRKRRALYDGVNVFALPQFSVPYFEGDYPESIKRSKKFIINNVNVFALPQYTVPNVNTEYPDFFKKNKLLNNYYSLTPYIPFVPPPALTTGWEPLYPDSLRKRKLNYLYDLRDNRNYVPIVPIVPDLSWNPTYQDYLWRRKLPVASVPYNDARDVGYFTDPPIPFDAGAKLVAIVDINETWEQHFINNSWANIQEQIDAGYPLYCQPTLSNGYYEEIIDFGVLLDASIISLTFTTEAISGTISCQPQLAYSDDGITYTSYVNGTQLFATNVRYVKFKLIFNSADDTSVAYYSNIQVNLSVRRETDQGRISCLASDLGGTVVNFNKVFRDVESITATPQTNLNYTAVIDFVDVPNPVSFSIYVFDSTGTRVNAIVDWIARGIT